MPERVVEIATMPPISTRRSRSIQRPTTGSHFTPAIHLSQGRVAASERHWERLFALFKRRL